MRAYNVVGTVVMGAGVAFGVVTGISSMQSSPEAATMVAADESSALTDHKLDILQATGGLAVAFMLGGGIIGLGRRREDKTEYAGTSTTSGWAFRED